YRQGTREVGELFDGDFVGDLEGELKIGGNGLNHVFEVTVVGEFVVGGADGLEDVGVFGKAVFLEAAPGEASAKDVSRFVVKYPEPTAIFPGGGADEDVLGG